ncbi:MAG: class I SAM-dependent methyltransferase [Candidatus Omnitrophota bacterium]
MDNKLKEQFGIRSAEFDISANWVKDRELIRVHTDLAGKPSGKALDLCCGTGQIGRSLKVIGWDIQGLDICKQMVKISSQYFPVSEGKAEKIPFESGSFGLIVCRQAFQFLNIKKVLSEIARVLAPEGIFILSLTVPFSEEDKSWLYEIHRIKQPLLLKFFTAEDLIEELKVAKFSIREIKTLRVKESVTKWMEHAPELSQETREKVIAAVKNAPPVYKKLHNVEVKDGELLEDWNWVILKTSFSKS